MSLENMVKKYIVTAAQREATPHKGFMSAIDNYAKRNDAQVIVVPMDGATADDVNLHPDLQKYTVANSYNLSEHFKLEDFPVKPQQIRPLTGLSRFVQHNKSAVFGSPKQHLECKATSNNDLPKILTTTGAITRPNYREHMRIGDIATRDHTYGALVVEVEDDGSYQYRHISSITDGSFIDINTKYLPSGKVQKTRPDALVLGDWHTGCTDEKVKDAAIEMIRDLKPKYVIIHDLFDGYSISHHDKGHELGRAKKAMDNKLNLKSELMEVGAELDQMYQILPKDSKIIVVKSNHDEVLDRYLDEGRFGDEPENLYLSSQLAVAYLNGKDPLKEGIEEVYGNFGKYVRFLGRDEDFKVRGWQLGAHGDLGGNGSRGSVTQQQDNYGKSIVGHRHTPAIRGDAWCVGTSTKLKLDYNRGPSNWMHTHALVHPNGKAQLVNVIDGKYRF